MKDIDKDVLFLPCFLPSDCFSTRFYSFWVIYYLTLSLHVSYVYWVSAFRSYKMSPLGSMSLQSCNFGLRIIIEYSSSCVKLSWKCFHPVQLLKTLKAELCASRNLAAVLKFESSEIYWKIKSEYSDGWHL